MKTGMRTLFTAAILIANTTLIAQTIAVSGVRVSGINENSITIGNIIRDELEKLDKYEILSSREMIEVTGHEAAKKRNKHRLINIGSNLRADYVISATAKKRGKEIRFKMSMIIIATQDRVQTKIARFSEQNTPIRKAIQHLIRQLRLTDPCQTPLLYTHKTESN